MRWYDIKFLDADGNLRKDFGLAAQGGDTTYTSYINGQNISGALNVEFNIPQAPFATPQQGSWLRVWGVGIETLAQSNKLSPTFASDGTLKLNRVIIQAGMQAGLPLANPAQRGLIANGAIFRPFGNWQGTDQTLEMVILPAVGNINGQTLDIPFNPTKGQLLSDAIKQSMGNVPFYTTEVFISDRLKLQYAAPAHYTTVTQFAIMIQKLSLDSQFANIPTVSGGKYGGVQVRVVDRTITFYDGTSEYNKKNTFASPKVIQFQDLIGQPTWIGPASINFKTVLRADISVGDYLKMPSTLSPPFVLTAPGASVPGAPSRNSIVFQGTFVAVNVRQYANFRSPSADAWVTVINASYAGNPSALISAAAP